MSDQAQSSNQTPESGQNAATANALIPFYKEGETSPNLFSARDANRLVSVLRALQQLSVTRQDAEVNPDGTYTASGKLTITEKNALLELFDIPFSARGGSGGSSNIVAMQVVSWTPGDDFLMAKLYDFDAGASGSSIKVALPWLLRVAQSPGGTSPQIWPAYAADDILIALVDPDFGTGITGSTYLAVQDRNWAQYISYTDGSCNPKHRIMVGGPEEDGA